MRDVVIEVGNQLTKNNDRNNQHEDMLKALGGAIIGLRMELGGSRIASQKLHGNQGIIEQNGRRKKENQRSNAENAISVQTQEGRWQGWIGNGQANVYQNLRTALKREVKAENAPLDYPMGQWSKGTLTRDQWICPN